MSALQHIAKAADKLSQNDDWVSELETFVQMWGIDGYEAPERAAMMVHEIVIAFLIAAREAKDAKKGPAHD